MSKIDSKKAEVAVRAFHYRMTEIEEVMSDVNSVVGCNPESRLFEAVESICEGYKQALDELYGIGEWLDWWWHECRLGDRPMKAGYGDEEEMREIKTIDDFVALILEGLEHEG